MPKYSNVTHFEVLGVTNSTSNEEIMKAYKALARMLHPNNAVRWYKGDDQMISFCQTAFRMIETAKSVLTSPILRLQYLQTEPRTGSLDADEFLEQLDKVKKEYAAQSDPKLAAKLITQKTLPQIAMQVERMQMLLASLEADNSDAIKTQIAELTALNQQLLSEQSSLVRRVSALESDLSSARTTVIAQERKIAELEAELKAKPIPKQNIEQEITTQQSTNRIHPEGLTKIEKIYYTFLGNSITQKVFRLILLHFNSPQAAQAFAQTVRQKDRNEMQLQFLLYYSNDKTLWVTPLMNTPLFFKVQGFEDSRYGHNIFNELTKHIETEGVPVIVSSQ